MAIGIFRGKRSTIPYNWIEGYLMDYDLINVPVVETGARFTDEVEVDPDTIGQCIDRPDKNNKYIFVGDFVKVGDMIVEIRRSITGWCAMRIDKTPNRVVSLTVVDKGEIIGNIYDNPEIKTNLSIT